MCYASNQLEVLKRTVQNLKSIKKELCEKQAEYDKLLSEKYHELEVKKFNAAEGYYLAKGLQVILQERRIIKHELGQINSLCTTINLDHLSKSIEKSNRNLGKLLNKNNTYTKDFSEDAFEVVQ